MKKAIVMAALLMTLLAIPALAVQRLVMIEAETNTS